MLTLVEILLVPAGLLPVFTAWALRSYRRSDSRALRERWHLALILAALGLTASALAFADLMGIPFGLFPWIVFGLVILAADVVSGKWLLDFHRGAFR